MQIPTDKRVKTYELTYLISGSLTGDEVQSITASVEKLIAKHKGSIKNQEDWGKKPMAYMIKHAGKRHTEAVYKHIIVEFETHNAFAFEKELYLNQELLRHLFVIAAEPEKEKKKAPKTAA